MRVRMSEDFRADMENVSETFLRDVMKRME